MTLFTPEWMVTINGVDYANVTLANASATAGRNDIYTQPVAGYCTLEILNLTETTSSFDVNQGLTLKLKDSSGTYVPIFGGSITDVQIAMRESGQVGYTTSATITALGALSRLPKALSTGVLAKAHDGTQIYNALKDLLINSWDEVPAATDWAHYDGSTETWANAGNVGLGEIDQPGLYELEARTSSVTDLYSLVSALATSGFGYLYEDAQGRISYADAAHRQNYLADHGYTIIDSSKAITSGVRTSKKSGDVRNDINIKWRAGNATASDSGSISIYGKLSQSIDTTLHNLTDAESQAQRYLNLRKYPRSQFDSITFPITSPNLDDTTRDALLNVFMGMPIRITNLPPAINGGQFEGFVEGWNWSIGFNSLYLTLNLSPIEFSIVAVNWSQVSGSETWNTLSGTLTWEKAIGAVA